jgi:hypothetical protein
MPFSHTVDLSRDPIWFDLQFEDTTMAPWKTLVRCEESSDGKTLMWVLRPMDGIRPEWPTDEEATPGVNILRLWRVELADSIP